MSTLRRILASRANGVRSRGPITPEGKSIASQNAIRHGLLARCVVLDCESGEGFEALLQQHLGRFTPIDGVELGMVEEMAAAWWRLRRLWAIEKHLMQRALDQRPSGDPLDDLAAVYRELEVSAPFGSLQRYETRLHRMYQRAMHNLLLLRAVAVPNEPSPISGHLSEPPPGPVPQLAAPEPPEDRRDGPE